MCLSLLKSMVITGLPVSRIPIDFSGEVHMHRLSTIQFLAVIKGQVLSGFQTWYMSPNTL